MQVTFRRILEVGYTLRPTPLQVKQIELFINLGHYCVFLAIMHPIILRHMRHPMALLSFRYWLRGIVTCCGPRLRRKLIRILNLNLLHRVKLLALIIRIVSR